MFADRTLATTFLFLYYTYVRSILQSVSRKVTINKSNARWNIETQRCKAKNAIYEVEFQSKHKYDH